MKKAETKNDLSFLQRLISNNVLIPFHQQGPNKECLLRATAIECIQDTNKRMFWLQIKLPLILTVSNMRKKDMNKLKKGEFYGTHYQKATFDNVIITDSRVLIKFNDDFSRKIVYYYPALNLST